MATQVQGNWKVAANLDLILGNGHPPARIDKPPVRKGQDVSSALQVDARNTANFRSTSYCGRQDVESASVQEKLMTYYRSMLQRIPLNSARAASDVESVKAELGDDDSGVRLGNGDSAAAARSLEAAYGVKRDVHSFRAVGILTQVYDPTAIGDELFVPWEFFVVSDVHESAPLVAAFRAMVTPATSLGHFAFLSAGAPQPTAAIAEGTEPNPLREDDGARRGDRHRLSVFTKLLPKFTGVYPGMAIGIIGEPFQRNAHGVLTGVLAQELVLPARPVLPWSVHRPLRLAAAASPPVTTRVHFCSGPYPRRDIRALLRVVTTQALHRGADVLVIGGPLIAPFENFERELLPAFGATFAEALDGFVDVLEETLDSFYSARPLQPRMKVVLVSHRTDVTQVPTLPTTMYALEDAQDIVFRSNPCRLAINGVHFGVCNEDVVGAMRERMIERWPTPEGSLRRVVECLVQSRLYTPLFEFPAAKVDLQHLASLRLAYVPQENELLALEGTQPGVASGSEHAPPNWDAVLSLTDVAVKAEDVDEEDGGRVRQKVKTEVADEKEVGATAPATECMPHVLFLPSSRPQFAVVTHRSVTNTKREDSALVDESDLDDVHAATGVLVVNQEIWSRRTSPRFELRVAEVTIPDSYLVAQRGASAANGVACGILHIFSDATA